ncbi:hypothetical protein IIV31_132L [Armadillidium vulgare iridescent virus]|uniref:Uncharacterized protein n=1 Tax=Armadillidium vulgare iridescent virus TaxID=72201 RepID=A0A068QLQ8_9VIRU|nr:hypothetical protein IIV31_132L [Armadillidium vulgare iridescent virus]CCV02504.1 hypothetical protein IIV31_132L [Armadillidium vulgare iridescent virus]
MENQRNGKRNKGKNGDKKKNDTIILGHPNDKPFGPLRNDYKFMLYLDEKNWDSVDNYVYSSLLPSVSILKKTIEHAKPTQVRRQFLEAKSVIDRDILFTSMKVGIEAKLKADPTFRQKLLDTTGSTILYLSKNNYLGYGNGRNFTNSYGIWLEAARRGMLWNKAQRTIKSRNPEMSDNDIYDSYLAEKGLKMALQFENLDRYLEKENLVEVIKELLKRYGQAKILIIDKETALALQRRRYIEPITTASHLVRYIRKTFIREVKIKNLENLKREAFSAFVDDLMEEKYTADDFERGQNGREERREIMKEQFATISLSEIDSLVQRTWKLFKAGALNKDVSDRIEKIIKETYIPSTREIDLYENDTVPIPTKRQPFADGEFDDIRKDLDAFPMGMVWVYPHLNDPVIDFGGRRLEHNEFDWLSPVNDSVPLKIKSDFSEEYLEYPSISHYLVVKVAQTVPGFESINKAYSLIFDSSTNLFFSINDAESQLEFIRSEVYNNLKSNLLMKAIYTKFEQRMFQDILLATGDRQLKYGKERKGDRTKPLTEDIETVTLLKEIREKILPEGTVLKPSGLKNATYYDEFLENYMIDKVNDISFTIKCVQVYCKHKGLPFSLTSSFVENVLDSFYGPCTQLSVCKLGKELSEPSQSFEKSIETNFRIRRKETSYSMTKRTARLIYEKIINTLLNLIEVLKDGGQPNIGDSGGVSLYSTLFKIALIKSQWILLTKKVDPKFDTRIKNQTQNKITSALINIIYLLNQRGALKKSHEPVDEVDVKVAASILIGSIQPITEISSSESKRSQLAAEINIENEIGEEDEGEGDFVENEEEEGGEEVEGQEYADDDDLQDFDEDADYEGQVGTIKGHLENLGLRVDHSIDQDIKSATLLVEKLRPRKLKLNFYA